MAEQSQPGNPAKLYSPKEAAELLDLTYSQVMKEIRGNRLRASRVGWAWTITPTAIEDYKELISTQ